MKPPNGERVEIIETAAKDWRKIGSQLNLIESAINWIEIQKSKDPVACCEGMLNGNGNGLKPVTWKTLIDILKDGRACCTGSTS